jgi:5,10-methylenetetrahydrofolate reductase
MDGATVEWDPFLEDVTPTFRQRIGSARPLVAAELRPPRKDLESDRAMDAWIDVHHTVHRLSRRDTVIFLTDNAVGSEEEESLTHLLRNLGDDANLDRIVPFLTLKHSLQYCLGFARRAREAGFPALVVLGGDRHDGIPRCLPHAYHLRERIREIEPSLLLGGWANPHRDPAQQVDYLCQHADTVDFALTQIVSHHDAEKVESFVRELRACEFDKPVIAGVFHYRSARKRTLDTLSQFIPVPRDGLVADFKERRLKANQVTAASISRLRELGLKDVYVSNLPSGAAGSRLEQIADLAGVPLPDKS